MKLLDKIGDAVLERLVPGMIAKANCGQCRYSHLSCRYCGLCAGTWRLGTKVYLDDCGHVCYSRCADDYPCGTC
jgi:ribosomal protein L32